MTKKNTLSILLVDDDKDMCESLTDVISLDSDYDVSYTTDPLKAIEMIQKQDFSLFILDYKMPHMNGLDLTKRIKALKPDAVIFILTAFISNELITEAKNEGADKVLSKFIWPDEILRHIKETIG